LKAKRLAQALLPAALLALTANNSFGDIQVCSLAG